MAPLFVVRDVFYFQKLLEVFSCGLREIKGLRIQNTDLNTAEFP